MRNGLATLKAVWKRKDHVSVHTSELRVQGRSSLVPTCRIEGREVIAVGSWLRTARLKDEEWIEREQVPNLERFISSLRDSGLRADIFAFSGVIDATPLVGIGHCDTDNVAIIRTDDFKAWWEALPQEARKNKRRAEKKGIEIRKAVFNDDLIAGIKTIYDETPIRQGRRFWHYGKDFNTIKRENGTYLDRSEFLAAYHAARLVGFLKIVYVGEAARIMQILCLNEFQDKRPIIALVVKAAEICHQKGLKYLIYGKFTYGRKTGDGMSEFKKRLGFAQKDIPCYQIPLSWRGHIALRLGLHKSWQDALPPKLINYLIKMRTWWLQRSERRNMPPLHKEGIGAGGGN